MYILSFAEITLKDLAKVGGKNASLGEMIAALSSTGIRVPNGYVINSDAYRQFIEENSLAPKLKGALSALDAISLSNLHDVGEMCRSLIGQARLPMRVKAEILEGYDQLTKGGEAVSVAVRSSATAEDLPSASFAGQHDSFLNISKEDLIDAVHRCYVSLFNDRAIKYRIDNGFDHMSVYLSVGIQLMVRSDQACAGVAFTIDPESGNENVVYITGAWGLGEAVVQGAVIPDEYYFFKPSLQTGKWSKITSKLGAKKNMMVFSDSRNQAVDTIDTPAPKMAMFTLSNAEALLLANWCLKIEQHYKVPMDIEWAKDGLTNELYILQARPETIHRNPNEHTVKEFTVHAPEEHLCSGKAVGRAVVSGHARIVWSIEDADKVQVGDIIIADITSPDWNALLKKAVGIVTNKGGRTSHASIVARELGIPAVVGTLNATDKLRDGQLITVSCAQSDIGYVYDGKVNYELREWGINEVVTTRTKPMFILADPDKALALSRFPNEGVGLMRMEFVINNNIQVHPMALVRFDQLEEGREKERINDICGLYTNRKLFFIDKLSEAIAMVAAAFYPKDVIVRMSDFKTNEYARLLGGKQFEPVEENPMLGFRGASRYYAPRYKEAFGLECAAIKFVRDEMGMSNVKVMIPFCRTVEEGRKVLDTMEEFGLKRGINGLEVYVMAEIPSNVLLAEQFSKIFDGFSIGSNDLTQLTLGLDRDSAIVSDLFDENNEAVKILLREMIAAAKKCGRKIGLCGQAPSDRADFSKFLVEQNIDSISFNLDAMIRGIENIINAEKQIL